MSALVENTPLLSVRKLCKDFPVLSKGLWRRQIGVVKACDSISTLKWLSPPGDAPAWPAW